MPGGRRWSLEAARELLGEVRERTSRAVTECETLALEREGRATEAEAVYWQDLRQRRENGYALFGLARSLAAQQRHDEAAAIERRFEAAWVDADTKLTSSRY